MSVKANCSKRAPEVVVFDSAGLSAKTQNSKHEYKAFMSSKIAKITTKAPKPKSKEERKEDKADRQNDRELKDLLEGKIMIEKLHESQLSGKERHKYNTEKLKRLGMKVHKKEKMPANMYFASQRNREERAQKAIKDANDRGVLTASVKRELERAHLGKTSSEAKKHKFKPKDRGPNAGPGKFKDGVLHISKSHIDRVGGSKSRVGKGSKSQKSRR